MIQIEVGEHDIGHRPRLDPTTTQLLDDRERRVETRPEQAPHRTEALCRVGQIGGAEPGVDQHEAVSGIAHQHLRGHGRPDSGLHDGGGQQFDVHASSSQPGGIVVADRPNPPRVVHRLSGRRGCPQLSAGAW